MGRHERRAAIAEFRRDAARADVLTYLVDASDTALVREPFVQAVLHWRGNIAVRKPRCIACGTSFAADGASVGGFLFATPEGANATSVSAFCSSCWTDLSDDDLERQAMRILRSIKPGARFAS